MRVGKPCNATESFEAYGLGEIMEYQRRKRTKRKERVNDERIKQLEKRIEELEKDEKEEPGIVGDVVSQFIPGLGGIVKTLEKTSPEFRKRIAATDAEIKHRLETGWNGKPAVNYGMSIKPLVPEREEKVTGEEEVPDKEPIVDIFEEKDYIKVIVEIPGANEKDLKAELKDNVLELSSGGFTKSITLPECSRSILRRTYKNGILQLKIDKEICR